MGAGVLVVGGICSLDKHFAVRRSSNPDAAGYINHQDGIIGLTLATEVESTGGA